MIGRRILVTTALALLIALGGCGKAEPTVGGQSVSHWAEALKSPDARLRKKAATKLGNVGTIDPAAVPALVGAVKDRDASVRAEAIVSLLRIGNDSPDTVAALKDAVQDRDATVRRYAAKALQKIDRR